MTHPTMSSRIISELALEAHIVEFPYYVFV